MAIRRIQIRFALALLAICAGGVAVGPPANAAPPFSLKKLHLGTSAGPEDYLFTRGNTVTGTGRVDASTYYRFVVADPSATTRSTSLCRPASLTGSVSGSYALGAADPLSGSNAWKFTLQEFTNSLCSGSPSKSAALYFDVAAGGACTSPKSYSALASGSHPFDARAIDQAGNVDPSPASRTWTINTALPAVTLSSPADALTTNDATPTFAGVAGTAPGDSSTVTVKVYAGTDTSGSPLETLNTPASGSSWSVDASPALPEGTYTVLAQQTGVAGTGTSSTAVFRVDTTAPAVSLRDPADGSATNDQIPTFDGTAGTANGDGGTGAVNLYNGTDTSGAPLETLPADGSSGAWSVDATSALAEGTYTVQAQQSDSAGNTGTSSPHTFRVDLTPPDTTITSAPTSPTGMQEASFRFVSSESASSFECRLDGGPWGACASPKTYSALAAGSHTFDVRAIDNAGNAD